MAEMKTASKNIVTSENHSKKPLVSGESSTANLLIETQLKSELLLDATFKEEAVDCNLQDEEPSISKGDIVYAAEKIAIPVVEEEREGQVVCKEDNIISASSGSGTQETPLVGRVKIKPLASLIETEQPNSKPFHPPFASGFDNQNHSLVMNGHPQFTLAPLIQRPSDRFLYYDNSTNMNLEKIINGDKIAQIPVSRPSFQPYVPINVPCLTRSLASMRNCSSTQTPPIFSESLDVPAVLGTTLQTGNHLNDFPVVPKNLSGPNFTPANKQSVPIITTPQSLIVGNADRQPNGVSSSNTDDLATSEDKEIIKTEVNFENGMNEELPDKFRPTEVDLEIELKEELPEEFTPTEVDLENESKEELTDKCRPTVVDLENESNEQLIDKRKQTEVDSENKLKEELAAYCTIGNHFIDVSNADPCEVQPELLISDPLSIRTSEVAETKKKRAVYELPTYSTLGTFSCKYCDFRYEKIREIKEHTKEMHTAENKYKCFYCTKNLSNKTKLYHKTLTDLEYHVAKVHRGMKLWRCKNCPKWYRGRSIYLRHVERECSNLRPYACHKCTFTCMTEASLEKHFKSHEKMEEKTQCPFCDKTVKKHYLRQHLKSTHEMFEGRQFRCISCNHASVTRSALECHYKRTNHDKQFTCHYCSYTSRTRMSIKHHIKLLHLKVGGEKFVCGVEGCEETTYSSVNMRYHRIIHSVPDSDLFTCPAPECLRKYMTLGGLKFHLRKTKHYLPHKCSFCPLRVRQESALKNHEQNYHVARIMKKMGKGQERT